MNEDRLIQEVLTLRQDVDDIKHVLATEMATKKDISILLESQDEILGIVKKLDQELTFHRENIKRVQDFVGMPY
ncbi:MAG: hypothetical protein KBD15_01905 [Candidatus Magasanikbacteria bacterium]|jgi:hypothetical protein|nr:hypothetical protein [Candidatus Magasanikbacteria bacterium]